jgi:hypothetical protein
VCVCVCVHIYTHISDCLCIVYVFTLLPNKTASETFLHKSGAVRSVDRISTKGAPAWRLTGEYVLLEKPFTIFYSNRKKQQLKLLPNFLPYRSTLRGLYWKYNNDTINYTLIIIICISNNDALINNNYGSLQVFILLFRIPTG